MTAPKGIAVCHDDARVQALREALEREIAARQQLEREAIEVRRERDALRAMLVSVTGCLESATDIIERDTQEDEEDIADARGLIERARVLLATTPESDQAALPRTGPLCASCLLRLGQP